MKRIERELKNKGYTVFRKFAFNDSAKECAESLREIGFKARVVRTSACGIYYYNVWWK